MKVTIHQTEGRTTIRSIPAGDVITMLDEYRDGEPILTLALGTDGFVRHINTHHITAIDVEPERPSIWRKWITATSRD